MAHLKSIWAVSSYKLELRRESQQIMYATRHNTAMQKTEEIGGI